MKVNSVAPFSGRGGNLGLDRLKKEIAGSHSPVRRWMPIVVEVAAFGPPPPQFGKGANNTAVACLQLRRLCHGPATRHHVMIPTHSARSAGEKPKEMAVFSICLGQKRIILR